MKLEKDYPGVKTLFIFGIQGPGYKEPHYDLEPERQKYCDIVQFDYVDEYFNITMDSISALKFALGYDWKGQEPDFVAIADDDTYIHIPNLWKTLYVEQALTKNSRFLMGGYFSGNPVLFAPDDLPNGTPLYPLYVPRYLYDDTPIYPIHLSGGFYIMPFNTLHCIYATAFRVSVNAQVV